MCCFLVQYLPFSKVHPWQSDLREALCCTCNEGLFYTILTALSSSILYRSSLNIIGRFKSEPRVVRALMVCGIGTSWIKGNLSHNTWPPLSAVTPNPLHLQVSTHDGSGAGCGDFTPNLWTDKREGLKGSRQ